MKNIILVGLIVSIVLVVVVVKRPSQSTLPSPMSNGEAALSVASSSYDFGTISMAQGKVSRAFMVTNAGTQPVKLGKLSTSCMCTEATLMVDGRKFGPFGMAGMGYVAPINRMLQPGQSAELTVIFDPAAHGPAGIGKIGRTATLESDGGAPVTVSFMANVIP